MFSKVLVANRGEIAVRALRAAREIGAKTVAVFPHEDRWSEHRMKAEEAYEIGEVGHPVRAYLDPEAIVGGRGAVRRRRGLPRLRLPVGEPGPRRGLRRGGHHLHRPQRRGAHPDRQQGARDRRGQGRRRTGARVGRALDRRRRSSSRPPRHCSTDSATPRSSSRPSPAAAVAACARSTTAPTCARPSRPACARPRAPSATRPSSSSRPSSTRATSRCRSSPTAPAPRAA